VVMFYLAELCVLCYAMQPSSYDMVKLPTTTQSYVFASALGPVATIEGLRV
jgi:hypothetical protein